MTGTESTRLGLHSAAGKDPPVGNTAEAEVVHLPCRWLNSIGDGVAWRLAADSQLNVNLVRLEPGHAMARSGAPPGDRA